MILRRRRWQECLELGEEVRPVDDILVAGEGDDVAGLRSRRRCVASIEVEVVRSAVGCGWSRDGVVACDRAMKLSRRVHRDHCHSAYVNVCERQDIRKSEVGEWKSRPVQPYLVGVIVAA